MCMTSEKVTVCSDPIALDSENAINAIATPIKEVSHECALCG